MRTFRLAGRRWLEGLGVVLLAAVCAGCATPQSRIERHPELFSGLPADAQEKIQGGAIDLGFTHDMVYLAFGRPDRVYARTTSGGAREIWAYTRVTATPSYGARPYPCGRYWGRRCWWRPAWPVDSYVEFEAMRVEFTDGRVSAIEKLSP